MKNMQIEEVGQGGKISEICLILKVIPKLPLCISSMPIFFSQLIYDCCQCLQNVKVRKKHKVGIVVRALASC